MSAYCRKSKKTRAAQALLCRHLFATDELLADEFRQKRHEYSKLQESRSNACQRLQSRLLLHSVVFAATTATDAKHARPGRAVFRNAVS